MAEGAVEIAYIGDFKIDFFIHIKTLFGVLFPDIKTTEKGEKINVSQTK